MKLTIYKKEKYFNHRHIQITLRTNKIIHTKYLELQIQ